MKYTGWLVGDRKSCILRYRHTSLSGLFNVMLGNVANIRMLPFQPMQVLALLGFKPAMRLRYQCVQSKWNCFQIAYVRIHLLVCNFNNYKIMTVY